MNEQPLIAKVFAQAWNYFRQAPFRSVVTIVLLFIGNGLFDRLVREVLSATIQTPLTLAIIYGLIIIVSGAFFLLGAFSFHLAPARGRDARLGVFFDDLARLPAFLAVQLALGVLILAIFLPAGLLASAAGNSPLAIFVVLLAVVATIWLSLRLAFASLIIADMGGGAIDAISASFRMTAGHFWSVFLCFVVMLLIVILGLLALIFPVFITTSIAMYMYVVLYDHLRR